MTNKISLINIDSLWDFNNPSDTEKLFIEQLKPAKNSDDKSYYIQLLTQLARSRGLQRKFEEAHKTLDEAEKLLEETDDKLPLIRYLLERGRVYNSSGNKEKATGFFHRAWDEGLKAREDGYAVDAAHMIAITSQPDEALEWNLKAMKFAESSDNENAKKWLGSLYNNIGWTYHSKKDYQKALEYFERYLKWNIDKKNKELERIAKWSIAKTKRYLNKTDESLKLQMEILNELEENKIEKDGYVFEEIAECLLVLNKEKESKDYFKKAYELLSKDIWLQTEEKGRLERLRKLSE